MKLHATAPVDVAVPVCERWLSANTDIRWCDGDLVQMVSGGGQQYVRRVNVTILQYMLNRARLMRHGAVPVLWCRAILDRARLGRTTWTPVEPEVAVVYRMGRRRKR